MTTKTEDSCNVPHCRKYRSLTYYGHLICDTHWLKHCEGEINLKTIFDIKDEEKEPDKPTSQEQPNL